MSVGVCRYGGVIALVVAIGVLIALLAASTVAAEPQAGTYVVTSSGNDSDVNPGDDLCLTGARTCTLRAAIEEANADGVPSLITFAEPMDISYPNLPELTENFTTIDASARWDGAWPAGEPGVSLGGGAVLLTIKSSLNEVYGIEFHGGNYVGIEITTGHLNTIGGTGTGQRNVFLGGTGVNLQGSGSGNHITGNYFGTRDGNTTIASSWGVSIYASGNTIENNLIVGHSEAGIFIWGGASNIIGADNIIGLNRFKSAPLPNAMGIFIRESNYNLVKYNYIAGNTGHGIELHHADHSNVYGNIIGYSAALANGGNGIQVFDSDYNNIGGTLPGNTIEYNNGYGVWLLGDDNTVQTNFIYYNDLDGIYLDYAQRNLIGGTNTTLTNSIGVNGGNGVTLSGHAISNTLRGNLIGVFNSTGDAGNQGHGIYLADGAQQNRIGGLGAGEGNRIAWNELSGIYMTGSNTQNNVVEGNVIGAPSTWEFAAPNGNHGISIYNGANHNWIGWGNTIVSSSWSGVAIVNSDDNIVWFNYIGTNSNGINRGNSYYGVAVVNGASNTIFGNEIGFNGNSSGQAGVRIDGGLAGNPINANSIHDNVGAGIELVNGGNFGLGSPTVTQASCQAQPQTQTQVKGTGCADCLIEIFSDSANEGRIYEGTTTANGAGSFTWNGTLHGPHVTATSTTSTGATSPFSAPFNIGGCVAPRIYVPYLVR